ncbi:macrophage mannose receptor 1-like [Salvelinus fontinalis]|uniref:macrophage mannose receptor 1-like n=1 Tax=Salvelinus fontinalis TaxID=8038 RepID=UPI00248633DB|nr:macrophage mannose receptor 1-like [Salvelinus fontinalis]
MDPNGQWFEDNCQIKRAFVCFDGKNASNSHIFIDDSKTWREAQDHCRGTYTDLASIRSREENHHVQNMSLSQSMWIGLFKDPWKWSDGSNSSYRFWKTNQPNNFRGDQNYNLILIRENMTWNEALSYCREHHVDLVSITTELLQYWVTERAANATSSHVWVGLRFTCSFHFWFWIRSDAGCYQNWAPGHGSDSQQDCGIAGAVETTGRQQWVSLEENQRLNFICYKCSGDSGEGLIHP